jgi:hypothetical protein
LHLANGNALYLRKNKVTILKGFEEWMLLFDDGNYIDLLPHLSQDQRDIWQALSTYPMSPFFSTESRNVRNMS